MERRFNLFLLILGAFVSCTFFASISSLISLAFCSCFSMCGLIASAHTSKKHVPCRVKVRFVREHLRLVLVNIDKCLIDITNHFTFVLASPVNRHFIVLSLHGHIQVGRRVDVMDAVARELDGQRHVIHNLGRIRKLQLATKLAQSTALRHITSTTFRH